MADYGHKMEEKNVGYAKWNEEKGRGNQQWREGNENLNQRFGPEGRKKHSTRTEWRNKNSKNKKKLRNLQDNFKRSNIWIIGVPEGEEQEIENLFENIMENFLNLVKEIDFQEVQEAQRAPKKLDPRKHTPRHIIITLAKIKEERILKAAENRRQLPTKEIP